MKNLTTANNVGGLLREWRERRRLSQLDLAYETEISQRHLSFVELGRAHPSRDMILRLAESLDVPLRERNVLLAAGGFAAVFPERSLDDGALGAARRAVDLILKGLEPNPSFAVDRHWKLVAANRAARIFMENVAPPLLEPPVNMLRICLHPEGFTPQVVNYAAWRRNILEYLKRQIAATADLFLLALYDELKNYPKPINSASRNDARAAAAAESDFSGFAIPLHLATNEGTLSFISTVTIFGTPIDVTLSELAIESFFPADERTAEIMARIYK